MADQDQKTILGKCPHCGDDIINGKYGPYCQAKCGFTCKKAYGKELTLSEVKKLLKGEEVLLKGLVSKKTNNSYDMYVKPNGVGEFSFTNKEGKEIKGYSFDFETRFDNGDKE